jgi:transposase, IS30 family
MGQRYTHFSLEDRCEIARLRAEGRSLRQIAAALDRSPSSISRELKRNDGVKAYKPAQAEEQARARRWSGSRLERQPQLRKVVLNGLGNGLSPEQVAGRLKLENGSCLISHETIYRFIYAQITRHNDFSWRNYLPRAKAYRGFRGRKGGSSASFIQQRVSIAERPADVATRSIPGHWEADLILFAKYGQAILTLHERTSRILIAQRPPNKTADLIASQLHAIFELIPEPLRQTVTFDNGTEFARHFRLHGLHLKTYFCNTHSPWQKGGIENAIGRTRRFLPRKTNLAGISDNQFNALIAIYNNTPRKCLDFSTPAEVFIKQLLHFKCESTSRRPPG